MKIDKNNSKNLLEQIKSGPKIFILYLSLRTIVFVIMILQFLGGNFENAFLCLLTLILFLIPSFVESNFHICLPDTLETIILLSIFAASILGEINSFYTVIPMWDTMLHTLNGFLIAAIGFSLVDILNRNKEFSFILSPFYVAIVAFCFSMTIGVIWEFFECGMDLIFGMDMQKDTIITTINSVSLDPNGLNNVVNVKIESLIVNGEDWTALYGGYLDIGLLDTMMDLLVNAIGAFIFSIIGFLYVKNRGKGNLAKRFIPKVIFLEKNKTNL